MKREDCPGGIRFFASGQHIQSGQAQMETITTQVNNVFNQSLPITNSSDFNLFDLQKMLTEEDIDAQSLERQQQAIVQTTMAGLRPGTSTHVPHFSDQVGNVPSCRSGNLPSPVSSVYTYPLATPKSLPIRQFSYDSQRETDGRRSSSDMSSESGSPYVEDPGHAILEIERERASQIVESNFRFDVKEGDRKRVYKTKEKNRIAARMCRRKKKEYIKCLEQRVLALEEQNRALMSNLKVLTGKHNDNWV
eukprot:Seg556.1 transcript_id=Seg556.1/GoldUCD/mRNA.D3Y31 product="Cyclic AMP-responsive element-binding protein 1" protein_id=Seg556.1/GoldUCD/D3Y31